MNFRLKLILIFLIGLSFSTGIFAQTVEEELEQVEKPKIPLAKRLVFGGNLGFSFGNVTYLDISPTVGYRVTDNFIAGVGVTYIYIRDNRYRNILGRTFTNQVLGPKAFVRYRPLGNIDVSFLQGIFLHGEFEYVNFKYIETPNTGSPFEVNRSAPGLLLGGGYSTNFDGVGFTIEALYNVLWKSELSYTASPWNIRVGFAFGI